MIRICMRDGSLSATLSVRLSLRKRCCELVYTKDLPYFPAIVLPACSNEPLHLQIPTIIACGSLQVRLSTGCLPRIRTPGANVTKTSAYDAYDSRSSSCQVLSNLQGCMLCEEEEEKQEEEEEEGGGGGAGGEEEEGGGGGGGGRGGGFCTHLLLQLLLLASE